MRVLTPTKAAYLLFTFLLLPQTVHSACEQMWLKQLAPTKKERREAKAISHWRRQRESRSYLMPAPFFLETSTRLVNPINKPVEVSVWDFQAGGQYNADIVNFYKGENGKWVRRPKTRTENLLTQFARPKTGQGFLDLLLSTGAQTRMEQAALLDMKSDGYLNAAEMQFHSENSNLHHPSQITYIESTSWMSIAEVRYSFGEKIPWERVTEANAPSGLSTEEVKKQATHLKIRRASLRVVAGMWVEPTERGSKYQDGKLPWQLESHLNSQYQLHPNFDPIAFEIGRLSQIPGSNAQVKDLFPFAAAAMINRLAAVRLITGEPFHVTDAKVFAHALDKTRARLFKKVAPSFKPRDGKLHGEGETLFESDLGSLIRFYNPSKTFEDLGKMASNWEADGWSRESPIAVQWMTERLQLVRSDQTARYFFEEKKGNGPVQERSFIMRDFSPYRASRLKVRLMDKIPGEKEALLDTTRPVTKPEFLDSYDVGHQNWKRHYPDLKPMVLSNIFPETTAKQVVGFLLSLRKNVLRDSLPQEGLKESDIIVALKDDQIGEALIEYGFSRLENPDLGTAYTIKFQGLEKLLNQNPDFESYIESANIDGAAWWLQGLRNLGGF